MTSSSSQPALTYPCRWSYKIIGADEARIRAAVSECLARSLSAQPLDFELDYSRTSRGGNYISLHLQLQVQDQAERDSVFQALNLHDDIRLVI